MTRSAFRLRCGNPYVRISQLEGQRVGLWGWGREGRAAYRALRRAHPGADPPAPRFSGPLTLFCTAEESADAQALGDALLHIETTVTAERLSDCDVVIKSPGISPYSPHALAAAERGTRFLGGTALWFAEHADAATLCVTGTKGKSTTTALLAHLLRAAGVRTALAGNIGMPLLELLDAQADAWAIELSSYQTCDIAQSGVQPRLALITNIHPEHLDWHGSQERYVQDKLALVTQAQPRIAVLNAQDPVLAALQLPASDVRWFAREDGWHMRDSVVYRAQHAVFDSACMPLPGAHNRGNLCGVLAALEAIGLDAAALAPHAASFRPLPNRLQSLGMRDGIEYVNDSISTTPYATLAALEVFRHRPVAVIVGGHDRGVEWDSFAHAMRMQPPHAIITQGQNGPRIHALLEVVAHETPFALHAASDLADAVAQAQAALGTAPGGVLLLSPGAPSFGAYRDYVARGRHFAELGGFDPAAISAIPGLGIA